MGASSSSSKGGNAEDLTISFQVNCEVAVEDVIVAAEKAGKEILKIYNGSVDDWNVELKSDSSPVTIADKAADRVIAEALVNIDPHIPIISEESVSAGYEIRKKYKYFWMVDPLDGTKEFLKRNGQFTVNIALIYQGAPVLGVVHVPCTGKTYWALHGRGAHLRENGVQRQIHASVFRMDDPGLKVVGSASHGSPHMAGFMSLLKEPEMKTLGSSLKLLMVAEGAAHMYPRFAPTTEWDTAAADIVVREAGGVVLQAGKCAANGESLEDWRDALLQQKPLLYNKEDLLNPFFVVFGKKIEDQPVGS